MYQNTCTLNKKCNYIDKLTRIRAFNTAMSTNSYIKVDREGKQGDTYRINYKKKIIVLLIL